MSHQSHTRRISTPGASRLKRKEWEPIYPAKPTPPPVIYSAAGASSTTSSKLAEQVPSNQLLAGYMAHEFLTMGTLLGQKFDPARAEAVPVSSIQSWKRGKYGGKGHSVGSPREAEPSGNGKGKPATPGKNSKQNSYAEVAALVKSNGTHIPGIVNPTQLARWIQM